MASGQNGRGAPVPVQDGRAASPRVSRVLAGDVLVDAVENADGTPGVRATFAVTAQVETIWRLLTDYTRFQEVFTDIDFVHVIEQDSDGALVEFAIDGLLRSYRYVVYRRHDVSQRHVSWSLVSGDLDAVEGFWRVFDISGHPAKLLVYESYVRIGRLVPAALARRAALRRAEEMAYRLRNLATNGNDPLDSPD